MKMTPFPSKQRRRSVCLLSDKGISRSSSNGNLLLREPKEKMSCSLSTSFAIKIKSKPTETLHVFQPSSAPIFSNNVRNSIGKTNTHIPLDGQNQVFNETSQSSPSLDVLRSTTQGSEKSERGTGSLVTEKQRLSKLSLEKRSENAQQREQRELLSSTLEKAVTFHNSVTISLTEDALADKVFSSPAIFQKDTLIRPQPIKSGPSGAEVPLAAPVETISSSEKSSRLLLISSKSSGLKTNSSGTNSSKDVRENDTASILKKNKPRFEKVKEKTQKERELLRAKRKAEIRKLQELQCDFPESQSNNLTPRKMSGSDYDDRQMPHVGNMTNDDYADGQRPQAQHSSENNHDGTPPTPLFERLVTEEVHELKAYARILESQNRRLAQLERVHGDLEARLQVESQGRQQLEATLEAREREWAKQLELLESDRNHWRQLVQVEETKNMRLMEEVMRKEQEIRRMLQRKYDHDGRSGRAISGRTATSADKGEARSPEMGRSELSRSDLRSPHDVLKASGSAEKVRLRNMEGLLQDFFGM